MKPTHPHIEQVDTETMEAPKQRIADAVQAHSVATRLAAADDVRDRRRREVAGLINRNRPYDPARLKALGQGHRSNVNFGKAESIVEDVFSTYWDIATNVPTLVDVQVGATEYGDPVQRKQWGQLISAATHELLDDEWEDFYYELSLMLTQFVYYGVAPVAFSNRKTWKFESWKAGGLLVPNRSKAKVSDWRLVATPGTYTVDELFGFYENAQASGRGWNKDAIKSALERAYSSKQGNYNQGKWLDLHQKLRNGDLHESVQMGEVDVWHVYVREFDGRVTHMIVDHVPNRKDGDEPVALYKRVGEFEDMGDFLHVFFRNYGDGSYHSVRGVGDKIFAHGQLDNRMLNNAADMLAWSSSIIVQANGVDTANEEIPTIKVGPVTVLPRQYSIIDGLAGVQLNSQITGLQLFQRQLTANVKVHQPDALDQTGRRAKSATQASIDASEQANLQKSEITFFLKQLDRLYRAVVFRLIKATDKAAKAWREKIIAEGVPEEVLDPDVLRVRAGRTIGYGSVAQRRAIVEYLDAHLPMLDEQGQKEALRLGLASVGGQELVDIFMPRVGEPTLPNTDATLVGIENAMLQQGFPLPVGAEQMHLFHIENQLPMLAEAASAASQPGVDRVAAARFLEAGIPHVRAHIEFGTANPATKAQAASYSNMLQNIQGFLKQLYQQIEEEQRAAARAQEEVQQQEAAAAEQERQDRLALEKYKIDQELRIQWEKEKGLHELRMFREQSQKEVSQREELFDRQRQAKQQANERAST